VNSNVLMAPRVIYAMGRDGLAPSAATYVSERGTPSVAMIGSAVVALLFLATGTFNAVIAIAAFFFVANYSLSFLAVFVLRHREPDRPRPYRAKGHPWTTGLVLVGSLCFLAAAVKSDTRNSLYALGIIVLSYPIFLLTRRGVVTAGSSGGYVMDERTNGDG
jgi:APA family basic amino acid/polyamine antiporter